MGKVILGKGSILAYHLAWPEAEDCSMAGGRYEGVNTHVSMYVHACVSMYMHVFSTQVLIHADTCMYAHALTPHISYIDSSVGPSPTSRLVHIQLHFCTHTNTHTQCVVKNAIELASRWS